MSTSIVQGEHSLSLLDICEAITSGWQAIDEAETPEEREALESAVLETITSDLVRKTDGIGFWLEKEKTGREDLKALKRRIDERIAASEGREARLRKAVVEAMKLLGERKLQGRTHTLSVKVGSASLVVMEPNKVPASYRVIIPATEEPNNAAIKKALLAGEEVAGCDLKIGPDTLLVR